MNVVPILKGRENQQLQKVGAEDAWAGLTQAKRHTAEQRALLVRPLIQMEASGCRLAVAIENLLLNIAHSKADSTLMEVAQSLGRKGKPVSPATLYRWVGRYKERGLVGLASNGSGRPRSDYGWEVRALHLYQQPTRQYASTVAGRLREEGWNSATDSRVRCYFKSLPTQLTTSAPKRVGRHYYNQNLRPYLVSNNENMPVGFMYEGDGHCCDVYVQHPATGNHYRPELTVWIDIRSQYPVGWWLSESESAVTTVFSLSNAIVSHEHVPAAIHTDPGSGYKNRIMDDELSGYLTRMSIESITALPGNAKGKGITEHFFAIFEERCGKRFESYCGHCRTDDALSRFQTKVKRGEIKVPTLAQYADEITNFIEQFIHTVHKSGKIKGHCPAELWATLEHTPVVLDTQAIVRPRARRIVRRWGVRHDNRLYRDDVLAGFDGKEVIVEYDMHDASFVVIRDQGDRFVCQAKLVEAKPWLKNSRIEDMQINRLKGQEQRLLKKNEENYLRANMTYDSAADLVASLEASEQVALEPLEETVEATPDAPGGLDIDLTSTDY